MTVPLWFYVTSSIAIKSSIEQKYKPKIRNDQTFLLMQEAAIFGFIIKG